MAGKKGPPKAGQDRAAQAAGKEKKMRRRLFSKGSEEGQGAKAPQKEEALHKEEMEKKEEREEQQGQGAQEGAEKEAPIEGEARIAALEEQVAALSLSVEQLMALILTPGEGARELAPVMGSARGSTAITPPPRARSVREAGDMARGMFE